MFILYLNIVKSKNSISLYIAETIYVDGKKSTKIIEKLGTIPELQLKLGDGVDPIVWGKLRAKELTHLANEGTKAINLSLSTSKRIPINKKREFNVGYLFLQQIYHQLSLPDIIDTISSKYKFEYNLDHILASLVYSRIIQPSSKHKSFNHHSRFFESNSFDLHHVYRALSVLSKESDFIQSSLYKNSLDVCNRNSHILYYDCTNFYFEIEQASGMKQYGISKENRPNPIVQMGLFMDGDGIPLAFSINPGNTNEQTTLKPLESKVIKDFALSKVVVCTDAGLSSMANRKFNNHANKAFITVQSIKQLKAHLKEWALDSSGWNRINHDDLSSQTTYNLEEIDDDYTYYKERYINENGFEQRLIVTYSNKYKEYLRTIRNKQIERAQKHIETSKGKPKTRSNSPERFIQVNHATNDGEVANDRHVSLNQVLIDEEEKHDGFYGVCTNLEDSVYQINKVNHRRWEIEETFRIMKSEFKARPVYLRNDDKIEAHFLTCFISLLIFRLLERKLDGKYTCETLVDTLRDMNLAKLSNDVYVPAYDRNEVTDALHDLGGFNLDTEAIEHQAIKNIQKSFKVKKKEKLKK